MRSKFIKGIDSEKLVRYNNEYCPKGLILTSEKEVECPEGGVLSNGGKNQQL